MPKYWGGNNFAHGSFPEVGQKQKTEKERKRERAKVGGNNGQATHGARKPPGPKSFIQYEEYFLSLARQQAELEQNQNIPVTEL